MVKVNCKVCNKEQNIKRDPCTGRYCAGHFNIVTEFEQSSRVEGAFGSTGV